MKKWIKIFSSSVWIVSKMCQKKQDDETIGNKHRPHLDQQARVMDCATCARDGHGPYHSECYEDRLVWVKYGVRRCWRPRGTIFIFDEREEH